MRQHSRPNALLSNTGQYVGHIARMLRARPALSLLGMGLLLIGLSLGFFFDDSKVTDNQLLENGQSMALTDNQSVNQTTPTATANINAQQRILSPQRVAATSTSSVSQAAVEDDQTGPDTDSTPEFNWQPIAIGPGDTLGGLFKQRELSPSLVHNIVTLNDDSQQLTRLDVGETIDIAFDQNGEFLALRREQTEDNWFIIEQTDDQLTSRMVERDIDIREREANGVITGNLFVSGIEAGMSDSLIMQLARIFGWDIDFALDIRRGDRFVVIYEEIWRDGEYLRDGGIVATSFVNRGETFKALRFETDSGTDYFTPEGKPMRKAFLRTPMDFARVTSNFNPRRMHPVLKRVKPHNGIDYGAPVGTPVYATGDGVVTEASYNRYNGNYVFIRHTNDIVTKYLHFSRKAVKTGQRVKQGQTIGYLGATGMVTAAHLHYEFVVGGTHRNPRTVDLPEAIPLDADQTHELLAQHQSSIQRLDELDALQLAIASTAAGSQ